MSQTGDWTSWLRLFFKSVIVSADEALQLVTGLDDLRANMHREIQEARSSSLLIKLVDSLFERPATSISAAGALLGVTAASASASIAKLESAGMLKEITGRTRDRVYVAPKILEIVSASSGQ